MEIKYPASWSNLQFKEIRFSLLENLRVLSSSNADKKDFDIDEIYHFFFDDTDLAVSPEEYIGVVLFDDGEVAAVKKIGLTLEEILSDLGNVSSCRYKEHSKWIDLIDMSTNAYILLARQGLPQFGACK